MARITNVKEDVNRINILRREGRILPNIVQAPRQIRTRIIQVLLADWLTFQDRPEREEFFRHQWYGEFGPAIGDPTEMVLVRNRGPLLSVRFPYNGDKPLGWFCVVDLPHETMWILDRLTLKPIQRWDLSRS